MADLTVSATFTQSVGQPATGLTLAQINLWLTEIDRATGAETVIWNGTQNPTIEVSNCGVYVRIYANADLSLYHYFAVAQYTGAVSLDQDWITGSVGITQPPIGTAKNHPYRVLYDNGVVQVADEGVQVWIYNNTLRVGIPWYGVTDANGYAKDMFGLNPVLDVGTYYVFRQKLGRTFNDPDTEVVV